MMRNLNLNKGIYSVPDSHTIMENLINTYNMSIMAVHKSSNVPIGVAVNGEFSIKDCEENLDVKIKELSDPNFGPILAICHQVDNLGKEVFKQFNTDTLFMVRYLAVKPEKSLELLATGLLSRVIQQASALGYKGIKAIAPHEAVKKACMENGMEMIAEIQYSEFEYHGKKVFSGITDHSSCAFM